MNLLTKIVLALSVWAVAIAGIVYLPLSETAEIVCVAITTTIMMQFMPKRKGKQKIIAE